MNFEDRPAPHIPTADKTNEAAATVTGAITERIIASRLLWSLMVSSLGVIAGYVLVEVIAPT
jgi:hypothetical protein